MMRRLFMIHVLGILLIPGYSSAAITTDSMLDEMTELARLTRLPDPPYTTRQFSSYNRQSVSPGDAVGWFANLDRGHYLRTEEAGGRTEYVMMDAAGPGAIVRIWSARPGGTMRVYLDGGERPAIEVDMQKLLRGELPEWPVPIAGVRARGCNLYFPIPYARHCKVTADVPNLFYHFNYRTWPEGTDVKSFQMSDLDRLSGKIRSIAEKLASPRSALEPPAGAIESKLKAHVEPGATAVLAELKGPAAVVCLRLRLTAEEVAAAARGAVLRMRFDGEQTVECPLGDFFGTAPGLTTYASLPCGIAEGEQPEMWCHWRMPFAERAEITVTNLGDQEVRLEGIVHLAPYDWNERSLHFFAKWRIERDIPTKPFTDWPHLECTGQGRFVGSALHIVNPVRKWWGEGDEKIYVDGESFPSHFGTGSEDYYGYAWCSPATFTHAYHNQPRCDGPGNYGNTSVNRFHVIDDIPFTKSFRFDMENWHHNPITRTTRAAVSYWYARPGARDFFEPITAAHVKPVPVPEFEVPKVSGAIEAEGFKLIGVSAGTAAAEQADERFSSGGLFKWSGARPGERLTLGFTSTTEVSRRVVAVFVLGPKSPRVQVSINSIKAGSVVDLSHYRITPAEEADLGQVELKQGENQITVEVIGPGAEGTPTEEYVVSFDYLRLK